MRRRWGDKARVWPAQPGQEVDHVSLDPRCGPDSHEVPRHPPLHRPTRNGLAVRKLTETPGA